MQAHVDLYCFIGSTLYGVNFKEIFNTIFPGIRTALPAYWWLTNLQWAETLKKPRTSISQPWSTGLVINWPMGSTELKHNVHSCKNVVDDWIDVIIQGHQRYSGWLMEQGQETATLIWYDSGFSPAGHSSGGGATFTEAPPASRTAVRRNRICSTIYQEETNSE